MPYLQVGVYHRTAAVQCTLGKLRSAWAASFGSKIVLIHYSTIDLSENVKVGLHSI